MAKTTKTALAREGVTFQLRILVPLQTSPGASGGAAFKRRFIDLLFVAHRKLLCRRTAVGGCGRSGPERLSFNVRLRIPRIRGSPRSDQYHSSVATPGRTNTRPENQAARAIR